MRPATKVGSHGEGYPTLAAIAVLGFLVACVAHEVVGHGGMRLALGRHVDLLTSVYFSSSPGGPLIAAAGPLTNLAVGLLCWGLLWWCPPQSGHWRLLLAFALAFNLFWGAGYFVFSAVTNRGDWFFVLRDLALQPCWLWRGLMGALGVLLYHRSMRIVAIYLPAGTPLVVPYLASGLVSCVAARFFVGPVLLAIREAAQESFGAGIGLLLLAYYRHTSQVGRHSPAVVVPCSNGWVIAAVVATAAFIVTLGHGFVFGSPA